MLGGQQVRAYKTIMETPRFLPRHTKADVRLFRVIAWGAFIFLAAMTAAVVAIRIARLDFSPDPVFLAVVPITLTLLSCWWLIDVAPVVSRWLVVSAAFIASIGWLYFAWNQSFWEQVQLAILIVYLAAVSRIVWQQIRAGSDENDEPERT